MLVRGKMAWMAWMEMAWIGDGMEGGMMMGMMGMMVVEVEVDWPKQAPPLAVGFGPHQVAGTCHRRRRRRRLRRSRPPHGSHGRCSHHSCVDSVPQGKPMLDTAVTRLFTSSTRKWLLLGTRRDAQHPGPPLTCRQKAHHDHWQRRPRCLLLARRHRLLRQLKTLGAHNRKPRELELELERERRHGHHHSQPRRGPGLPPDIPTCLAKPLPPPLQRTTTACPCPGTQISNYGTTSIHTLSPICRRHRFTQTLIAVSVPVTNCPAMRRLLIHPVRARLPPPSRSPTCPTVT